MGYCCPEATNYLFGPYTAPFNFFKTMYIMSPGMSVSNQMRAQSRCDLISWGEAFFSWCQAAWETVPQINKINLTF